MNGLTYCGYDIADSPHAHYLDHEFYNSDIHFFSDYSVAYAGFAICMLDDPPPSAVPTPAPTYMGCDTATAFNITSGDCTACGACFHTPNYLSGDAYDHNHDCTITALQSGWLDVQDFNIEYSWWGGCWYDGVIVDGTTYCGTSGPQGGYITPNSTISFYSDYSVAYDGAHICLS